MAKPTNFDSLAFYAWFVEWLHIHDGIYDSKNDWREELLREMKAKLGLRDDLGTLHPYSKNNQGKE